MGIKTVTLVLKNGAMLVESVGVSQSFLTPADLWQHLLHGSGAATAFHFTAPGQIADSAALDHALDQMAEQGAKAALGAVRDANNMVIAPLAPGSAAFAPIAAGSLVVTSHALRNLPRPPETWDGFWSNDLVTALHQSGQVLTLPDTLAHGGDVASHSLLPISRAGASLDPDLPTIIVLSPPDATCALYFDRFHRAAGLNLRILPPVAMGSAMIWLTQASAVIIPRGIAELVADGTTALLHRLRIPVFWFLDDDVFALAQEYPAFAPYLSPDFRPLDRGITGIITSTPALAEALKSRLSLPNPPLILPPGPSADWPRPPTTAAPVAAVVGGAFRGQGLRDIVLPALRRAAPDLRLAAPHSLRPFLSDSPAQFLPFEGDFLRFLHLWQALRPAVLLHPPGRSTNMPNKSSATLFVAHALGAVPVVAQEPAFDGWDETMGVLVARPGDWDAALCRAANPAEAAILRARLATEIARRGHDTPDLLALLGHPAPVSATTRDMRLQDWADASHLRPALPERRTTLARLRRSLWKRGLWPGAHLPRIASR